MKKGNLNVAEKKAEDMRVKKEHNKKLQEWAKQVISAELTYDNTLDNLLGDNLVAFGALIDLLRTIRHGDTDINADMLYALEKGLSDTLKDMRVTIGALDNAYKLVPTGYKYAPDKEPMTCKNCGKKYDWQDMLKLEDMHGRYSCNKCGHQKFEYTTPGGDLSEFPPVKEEV